MANLLNCPSFYCKQFKFQGNLVILHNTECPFIIMYTILACHINLFNGKTIVVSNVI